MREYFDKMAGSWDQDPMKIERSKVTAEYCKKVPLKATKKLLDFGGGTGLLSLYLHDTFDHITIADSSKEMLKIAQEKIKKANGATVLVDMIRDASTEEGKKCAIAALGNIANKCAVGANGSRALPLLMNVLKNNTEYSIATRTHAARAVINIGRKDGEVKSSVKGEYKTIVEEANKEAKHVGGDFQKQVRGLYFY